MPSAQEFSVGLSIWLVLRLPSKQTVCDSTGRPSCPDSQALGIPRSSCGMADGIPHCKRLTGWGSGKSTVWKQTGQRMTSGGIWMKDIFLAWNRVVYWCWTVFLNVEMLMISHWHFCVMFLGYVSTEFISITFGVLDYHVSLLYEKHSKSLLLTVWEGTKGK